jgi:hypothetical protein
MRVLQPHGSERLVSWAVAAASDELQERRGRDRATRALIGDAGAESPRSRTADELDPPATVPAGAVTTCRRISTAPTSVRWRGRPSSVAAVGIGRAPNGVLRDLRGATPQGQARPLGRRGGFRCRALRRSRRRQVRMPARRAATRCNERFGTSPPATVRLNSPQFRPQLASRPLRAQRGRASESGGLQVFPKSRRGDSNPGPPPYHGGHGTRPLRYAIPQAKRG